MDNLAKWIIVLSCLPVFAAAGYALYFYKRLNEKLRVFTWFLGLSGIIQLLSVSLWFNGINNMPLLHVYVAGGFFCITWFYKTVLRGIIDPVILYVVLACFLIFCICNAIFLQKLTDYDSYGLTLEAVFVIILSLSTMILSKNEILDNSNIAEFKSINWINAGLLIYYTSNILLFYFGDVLMTVFPIYMSRYTYIIHSLCSVIMYLCFFTALWKSRKN